MVKIGAVVLSAGLSSRMGDENKLFLPIDHKPMIEWVISNLFYANVHKVVVVSSDFSLDKLQAYRNSKVTVVENERYQEGMTTSIQRGILEMRDLDGFMICMGDQPFISASIYNALIHAFILKYPKDERCIIVPYHEGKKGNPVIFSSHYKEMILNHEQMEGCKEIIKTNGNHVYQVSIDSEAVLTDIDTPNDYESLA